MSSPIRWMDDNLNPYALITGSAAAGAALGILFGRGMERRSANIAALSLLATGALLSVPAVAQTVSRLTNRPASDRFNRRRLEGIRNGSVPVESDGMFETEADFPRTQY